MMRPTPPIRIYADVNSRDEAGAYWCLLIGDRRLDDAAIDLGLRDGQEAIIFHRDEEEEFEWEGRLWHRPIGPVPAPQWVATVNEGSFRRLR
jgi:hypothetical protein